MEPIEATPGQRAYWAAVDGGPNDARVIGGPEEAVDVIPCHALVSARPDGSVRVRVAYRPTAAELEQLDAGHTLWLTTWGGLPIHSLEVIDPADEPPARAFALGRDRAGHPCTVRFDRGGVEHFECGDLADVTPHLDAAYCSTCGWNERIDGAWFVIGCQRWAEEHEAGDDPGPVTDPDAEVDPPAGWELLGDGDLTAPLLDGLAGAARALEEFGVGSVTLSGRTEAGRLVRAVSVASIDDRLVGVIVDAEAEDGDVVWAVHGG